MTDRELAIIVCRALFMIIHALQKKYGFGEFSAPGRAEISERDSLSGVVSG
jgi:hypothetical protein